jgi:peroxiredoxin
VNQELSRVGGRLLAVAVDGPQDARRVVERNSLEFPILCDTKREVIRTYGLVHEGGALDGSDIAIPAHLLINRDGRIISRYVSRRIQDRLHPRDVLATVRRMTNGG